jgi:hypothetical protein
VLLLEASALDVGEVLFPEGVREERLVGTVNCTAQAAVNSAVVVLTVERVVCGGEVGPSQFCEAPLSLTAL